MPFLGQQFHGVLHRHFVEMAQLPCRVSSVSPSSQRLGARKGSFRILTNMGYCDFSVFVMGVANIYFTVLRLNLSETCACLDLKLRSLKGHLLALHLLFPVLHQSPLEKHCNPRSAAGSSASAVRAHGPSLHARIPSSYPLLLTPSSPLCHLPRGRHFRCLFDFS